jgi:shikimate kinase
MKIDQSIALIGFKGSGKSTLGRVLAKELRCPFVETDQMIEQFHRPLTCYDIYKTFGEKYFRQLESQVIASLKHSPAIVLATGGGSLKQKRNGEHLKAQHFLIYLQTSAEVLKERIWQKEKLPAFLHSEDPHQTFAHLYDECCLIYEQWADFRIQMDGLAIEQGLRQIIDIL